MCLNGHYEEALRILEKIQGQDNAQKDLQNIKTSIATEQGSKASVNYGSKVILTIIIIGSTISILQQFTGINAVLYYGADIFEKALGFGQDDVLKQQVLLAFINVVFTLVAMYSVDKIGRKPLIYAGSIGMIIGFLLLGVTQTIPSKSLALGLSKTSA